MHYGELKNITIENGSGVRVSLFVSGCRNHCFNCIQPETWDFSYGQPFTEETVQKILIAMEPDYIAGLTILGGDPMEPENEPEVLKLCQEVKQAFPDKTIWVYTGYLFEDFIGHELYNWIDVMVDGRFEEDLKNLTLPFRGSSNQRIIDVPASIEAKEVVLMRDIK